MIEVWGRPNSNNVMTVMWALEEWDIAHRRYNVGGSFGGLDTPEFLQMNPNGRIPVIKHNGKVLYESTTIVRYLAGIYDQGTLWPRDSYDMAVADQWMDWFKSTFYPAFHPVFWGLIRTPEAQRNTELIEESLSRTHDVLAIAEQRLQSTPYLAGETFSIGDMPLGACIYRYLNLDIPRPSFPAVEQWYQRLVRRSAYQTHVMIPFGRNNKEWLELEADFASNVSSETQPD